MSEYHDVTVMPGAGIIPTPGDEIVKFNRFYIAINPDPSKGPVTWRVSDPDEYPCDGSTAPPPGLAFMVVAQAPLNVSGDMNEIEYGFDMTPLPEDTRLLSRGQLITSVINLPEPVMLSDRNDDPVRSVYDNNDKATVTTFDIYGLLYEQYSTVTNRKMRATVYNSSRSIPVTSTDPVQTGANTASTDLFFDINSLPHES